MSSMVGDLAVARTIRYEDGATTVVTGLATRVVKDGKRSVEIVWVDAVRPDGSGERATYRAHESLYRQGVIVDPVTVASDPVGVGRRMGPAAS